MGPIECVKFAIDEHDLCENFAWVIFKHSSSVEDSIKLFRGTKLYGLPIVTKYYSKHLDDPVFHDQLDYFKQLVNVEHNSQSNDSSNKSRWIDRSSDNINNIPDSLPEPPVYDVHNVNTNEDNYDSRSNAMSRHTYKDKQSKYQQKPYTQNQNSAFRNEYNSIDKSYHSRGRYRKSDHNSSTSSMEVSNFNRDSYHQNYDRKHRDVHPSSKWQGSTYNNQESSYNNDSNSAKHTLPVRDLRDTMYRKHSLSDFHDDSNTNTACTSLLDLRDTMYHSKSSKYEDPGQFESDSNNQWSGKNRKNIYNSSFTDKESRKNNYFSERFNNSNAEHKNHGDREYNDQSYYQDKSCDNFQEHDNAYSNNYSDSYKGEKNRPNNYKHNHMRSQNMEIRNRQNNSYHPYKRNEEGYERKEYRNSYNERSGHNHSRSYNKGGSDRSRQNYYS